MKYHWINDPQDARFIQRLTRFLLAWLNWMEISQKFISPMPGD